MNRSYRFKEEKLPNGFCQKLSTDVEEYLSAGRSFTLLGMPAVSTSSFLKYLVTKQNEYTIYLDLYSLSSPTPGDFFKEVAKELDVSKTASNEQEWIDLCKEQLQELSKEHTRIVIVINRFGELEASFSKQFFGTLRTLRYIAPDRIIMIFSVTKPYVESAPDALLGGNIQLFTEYIYFKPLSDSDLLSALQLYSPDLMRETKKVDEMMRLSGGHLQLFQLLLKTERSSYPLRDPYVRLLLSEIYNNFSSRHQKQLQLLSLRKKTDVDSYLLDIGVVRQQKGIFQFFSPLFQDFIREEKKHKLPSKEEKLFSLLKDQGGDIVSKEDIFQAIWEHSEVSDWALDSLIYRLRRHPFFINSGYTLASYKKQGYVLIKK